MNAMDEIGPLADITVEIEMVLDRKTMTVRELLELEVGSLVRLSRSAGENIDLYVNDVLLAYGEVVVIENTLGARITDFARES